MHFFTESHLCDKDQMNLCTSKLIRSTPRDCSEVALPCKMRLPLQAPGWAVGFSNFLLARNIQQIFCECGNACAVQRQGIKKSRAHPGLNAHQFPVCSRRTPHTASTARLPPQKLSQRHRKLPCAMGSGSYEMEKIARKLGEARGSLPELCRNASWGETA